MKTILTTSLTRKALWTMGLLSAALLIDARPVMAQEQEYALVQVANPKSTDIRINYQLKWGENGEWKDFCLEAGKYRVHSYPLNKFGGAPTPYVRFDYDLSDSDCIRTHTLKFRAGCKNDPSQALPYVFRVSRDGNELGLLKRS